MKRVELGAGAFVIMTATALTGGLLVAAGALSGGLIYDGSKLFFTGHHGKLLD